MKSLSPSHWNFNDLAIPKELVTEDQIKAATKSLIDDMQYLEKDFEKRFKDRRSKYQIHTDNLRRLIDLSVRYDEEDQIDITALSKYIHKPDVELYKDVVNFLYDFFHGKPKSILTLVKFKGMLIWYLSYVGF